jgi:hypothetical protein
MEQVPQASGGEALHGRPEAPEYAGIPSHYSYTGRGAKPDGLVNDRTRSPLTDFAIPYFSRWLFQMHMQRALIDSTGRILRLSNQGEIAAAEGPGFLTTHLAELHDVRQ